MISFPRSAATRYLLAAILTIFALTVFAFGQKTKSKTMPGAQPPPESKPLELSYTLAFPQPHTHLYEVSLTIRNVATPQLDLSLPIWTPGSYIAREYARNTQDFNAEDGSERPLPWRKIDKATWRVETGAGGDQLKTIRANYRVYANELATQTSHLDATHAYFNGASLFMYIPGETGRPHRIKFITPEGWRVTTPLALQPDPDGYYTAPDYDRLIDSPTEIGTHKLLEFNVLGKPHRAAIWGQYEFDDERLKTDLAKIVEEDAKLFGGLPYDHYTFIIHVQPGIGGGTEHLKSNVSMTRPEAFKSERGYKRFLGLESHEYFHNWNVKRIRPLALGPFDYQRENYTSGLWVSEGVTSYYGDLILRRAGLISVNEYLEGLTNTIAGYEQTPGRFKQSAESASFDAWIKQYRPDENSINSAMSYYTSGELLGLIIDIEIRALTNNAKSLDDVMRLLLENHGLPKPGFTDAELKAAFEKVAGVDLTNFWNRFVAGHDEIDFASYFNKAGLQLTRGYRPGSPYAASRTDKPGALGLRTRASGDHAVVANVIAGLPAYEGGVNAGDELVAIDGKKMDASNSVERQERPGLLSGPLNDLRAGQRVTLTVFRRDRLMNFDLTAAIKPFDYYTITELKDAGDAQRALRESWLSMRKDGRK
ncbi:MAG: M61 family metallopeptidase [Chloracidobacterium sp.]|nr:M61 family metallopeptidase [Chloracidobacterium sp.]